MKKGLRRTRNLLYGVAWLSGLTKLLERRARQSVTILMYHRVLPKALGDSYLLGLSVTPDVFAAQLQWLSKHAEIMTVSEAMTRIRQGTLSPHRPTVCITFDDGYRDNALLAVPLLDRFNMKGTFFVATSFVLERKIFWFDRASRPWTESPDLCQSVLAEGNNTVGTANGFTFTDWMSRLKAMAPSVRASLLDGIESRLGALPNSELLEPMTAGDIRRLADGGHEIGSHTVTHPILTQLDKWSIREEVIQSKQGIEQAINRPVVGFCYPNGSFDDRVWSAVRSAGYEYACTTKPGRNTVNVDPLKLRRFHVHKNSVTDSAGGHSEASFAAVIWGLHTAVGRTGRFLGIQDNNFR